MIDCLLRATTLAGGTAYFPASAVVCMLETQTPPEVVDYDGLRGPHNCVVVFLKHGVTPLTCERDAGLIAALREYSAIP